MPTRTHITDYLQHHAAQRGSKPALVTDTRTLTWSELYQEVSAAAAIIHRELPADEQQVVAMLLPNSWQCVVTYLAIVHAGHIATPLDTSFKQLELAAVVTAMQPVLIITDAAHRASLGQPAAPVIDAADLRGATHNATLPLLRLPAAEQIASLMFTSGTTGNPKAAPYTHANHLWNIKLSTKLWNWTTEDTLLISLPLSHWHGIVMGISGALYHGNTLYLRERFNVEDTLAMLASGKISIHQHVSMAYIKLANHPGYADYDLSRVRLCTSASSALPPAAWQRFKDHFGVEILECYGSAEAGRIASNTLSSRTPGTPGRVIDGVELKIGSGGEVLVRTPGLFPGYYRNPEATQASFTNDGWWIMGDLGEIGPDRRLYLKGRLHEKVKKQGYSVYPRDIEWAVEQHPDVNEVYVLGVHDAASANDRLVYFVAGRVTEAEMRAYCKQHLPSAWRPDDIVAVAALPRTLTGKPKLAALRELLPAGSL